ncbi:DUF2231 domain-containing protein [Hymenobacter monticola]|uniref:DUF2231 domain-containing protein n=2 Tax=Hymenobacter TaxID=89966 RepID=A0ABY4BFH8_9BACT|nr:MULTISPECIES: DUF2231 domain-containing protein [Hymenobacter]MDU0372242.1 DUF2231 domain-containing protein [Hymenobacter endophyticus]UOE36523.1 hypothetical protein MTP16_24405 [Hymenobacter monticola]
MFSDFPNLHPLVVHLPIVLIMLAAALQALLVFKDWPQVRWIALAVMAGGFAGAVAASTVFHAMPLGLSPRAAAVFAAHEQFASYTTWLSGITLLLAGIGFYFKVQRRAYEVLVLVAAVAAAGALSVAGHRGAQLVYVEGVGPQGNLLDKSHGHGGEEEMPGMDMPTSDADAHSEEPGTSDGTRQPAGTPPDNAQPGMEGMNMDPKAAQPGKRSQSMEPMEGMNMPTQPRGSQRQPAPAGRSVRPGAMADMPGMNMPGMSTPRPSAQAPGRKAQPAQMDMGNMPGMDMGPARPKNTPRNQPAMGNMGTMKGMENMPGMQPAGGQKPGATRQASNDMSGMPGMKKGESMPGMGDMKDMDMKGKDGKPMEMKGTGTMPGMAMPSPMDKFRFEDNNPARNQPKSNN